MKVRVLYQGYSGFTENYRKLTGTEKAWRRCRAFSASDVAILTPREWNADAAEMAALIARHTDPDTKILLSGYSWGGGWGFLRLADQLAKRDRRVWDATLVDPVKRSRWTPTRPLPLAAITNPLSMVGKTKRGRGWFPIKIPNNVRHVRYFRQAESIPAGRRLVAADPKATLIQEPVWIGATHTKIDDDPRVLDAIFAMVEKAVNGEIYP